MNRLYFSFDGSDEYFAKTTEIDNQTKAIITALYPYIKANSSFTFKSISIGNQAPNDEMEYITVRKNSNGVVDIEGGESLTEPMCERIFIDNFTKVEYYGTTKDLVEKMVFANDGLKFADKKEASAGLIKTIASETPKQVNDISFNVMSDICDEILSTLKKKNDDYGNSYIKNIERFGKQAMLIPMFNKLDRLESLSKKENQNFESFEDSLRDLMGYCLMATQHLIKTKGK